jgi:hypothetical protein
MGVTGKEEESMIKAGFIDFVAVFSAFSGITAVIISWLNEKKVTMKFITAGSLLLSLTLFACVVWYWSREVM